MAQIIFSFLVSPYVSVEAKPGDTWEKEHSPANLFNSDLSAHCCPCLLRHCPRRFFHWKKLRSLTNQHIPISDQPQTQREARISSQQASEKWPFESVEKMPSRTFRGPKCENGRDLFSAFVSWVPLYFSCQSKVPNIYESPLVAIVSLIAMGWNEFVVGAFFISDLSPLGLLHSHLYTCERGTQKRDNLVENHAALWSFWMVLPGP